MTARLLLLVRHAQAVPAFDDNDRGRVLTAHGRDQARAAGIAIAASGLVPATLAIWCSPAARTVETADLIAQELGEATPVRPVERLYDAAPEGIVELLKNEGGHTEAIMIVGHNPTMAEFCHLMSGNSAYDSAHDAILLRGYPPATVTAFRTNTTWADFTPEQVETVFLKVS
ncbi:SixA phosphatase family protein [Brytella acorum]|uniref:Histidine phosphatase family protein n=1 Tax=Brytella acorum TaxID=2959299 RepID=A0AA35UWC0_9PROT|nr:histidine phosphatase family protein [Brytella acorum]MDF3624193.1 histidine phosphatase family protein [Brytella acorum]CAI9120699.1 histidine phosphatase family protein [Brytella acorum]